MGGLFVVVALFLAGTKIIHIWGKAVNANVLHIVEATYGKSCQGFFPPRGFAGQPSIFDIGSQRKRRGLMTIVFGAKVWQ
jgi:hypothetical protein